MKSFTIPTKFTAVDKFTGPVDKMGKSASAFAARTQRDFRTAGQGAFELGRSAGMVGLAVAAPLALMAKSAIDFEDKMADVGKTTQLAGKPLEALGETLLGLSKTSRTSIDDLVKIAEIGGQLGIAGKDLAGFTKASNEFNIALGADFSGGVEEAITSVGKIKNLFAETRDLNIADAIKMTGSAINELGAKGAGTSANITDFTLRLGALPDALKPSLEKTLALGTFLEELGINAQIASSGTSNLLKIAGGNIGGFAKQMGVSQKAAQDLLAVDPVAFATQFSKSFKGLKPDVLAKKLEGLKIGSLEVTKVIGALGTDTGKLTELTDLATDAIARGTSLSYEAAKKNSTRAATLAILKNRFQAISITLGNALLPLIDKLSQKIVPLLESFGTWVEENKGLVVTILKVTAGIGALALGISAVSFAVGIYQKGMVIARASSMLFTSGLAFMKSGLVAAKLATVSLNGAMMLTPLGLLVAGLTAVAGASYMVYRAFNQQTTAQKLATDVSKRALDATIDQRVESKLLFDALRRSTVGTTEYAGILTKIDALSPGLVEKYNLQAGALGKINQAEKDLTASIMARAEEQARAEIYKEDVKNRLQLESKAKETAGQGMFSEFIQGFYDFDNTNSQVIKRLEEAKKREGESLKGVTADEAKLVNPKKNEQVNNNAILNGGKITSDVVVNINGATPGTTATATSSPVFTPTTGNTRGN